VKSKVDKVEGELDSRAVSKTSAANATVHLTAELPSSDGPAPSIGAAAGGDAKEANATAAELRILKLDAKTNKKVAFYYPYLSPGELTSLTMDEQGTLAGEGTISPTVPIFDKLAVRFKAGRSGDDLLELVAPIAAEKLNPNNSVFRFTRGELALQLSPSFLPKGTLAFEVGPKGKPVILGELTAKLEGGAFVATGTLKPGGKVPGISDAAGEVSFNSDTGWAGKLTAKSTAIPGATVDAELGFTSSRDGLNPYGRGGLHMDIKGSPLDLAVTWRGGALSYSGSVTILKPLPLVEKVKLSGQYANDAIALSGEAAIKWKSIAANMTVLYLRKDGEEGRFSGTATVTVKTEKADGSISLSFDEAGHYWGKGSLTYQVTKDIRPTLGVELTKDQRVRLFGEVAVGTIPLSGIWPPPAGGKVSIIKGIGAKFNIPTPVPGITAYGELRGSLGLGYGVGPVMLVGVKFSGELYPLEDDPKVKAKLSGSFAVPAYASLEGTFGAYIGVEVLLGAAGAKGGIDVTPGLTIRGEGGLAIDADYDASGFSFSAEAYAKGTLNATVKVDLVAEIYAVWGLFSHSWKYNVADLSKQIGPELKLSLGKIAYSKDGQITWPDPSQIKLDPENIDPLEVVKELMGKGKAEKVAEGGGAGAGSYAPPIA
jgi:hypothetical protein